MRWGRNRVPALGHPGARCLAFRLPTLRIRRLGSRLVGWAFLILLFPNAGCGESLALCPRRDRVGWSEKWNAIYAVLSNEALHPITGYPSKAPLTGNRSKAHATDPRKFAAREREVELCVALCTPIPHGWRDKRMNADRRIIGVNTLIALPLGPLAAFRAVAHKEATDRGVWRTCCWIKVGRDLDPDITWTRNIRIWWFGRVELEPTKLELLGILGRESGAVWTAFGKRCQDGSALCG
jgi:hypothetical protein